MRCPHCRDSDKRSYSVGAIHFEDRFCASRKGRIGGGGKAYSHEVPCTWWLSWLNVKKPWSALAGPFLSFSAQMAVETTPLPL